MKTKAMVKTMGILAAIALFCGSAGATTVVDDFSYSDGVLTGQGSAGGGWAGAWALSGAYSLNVSSQVATATGPGSTNTKYGNSRDLATPMSVTSGAPTIWLSFDMKVNFEGTQSYTYDQVVLEDGTGNPIGCTGRQPQSTNLYRFMVLEKLTSPYYKYSTTNCPDDTWVSICLKIVPTGNGTSDYTMWVNPNYSLTEDDPNQVAPTITGQMTLGNTITRVNVNTKSYSNTGSFDNLRLSDESSLFVPEPATMSLLAVGTAGLLLRRRR